ncbi:hydrogenase nickel incorporation protein HypB [Marimonas arenosa]|uniref:Hydrogenase maturation factor HypB n=1 Tax=Marimonas arenosa TaxID=1795305 RepID=A0AAE3WAQ4_9RHOB|nr:hydrogenase nickel incorporation protein HypB [Marimonas arenosa]MDQ2089731.1 hydrogenase nickel incorporation protein HypB [Marimonas arenosa]
MCTTCGCGHGQVTIDGQGKHVHDHDHAHDHGHEHGHDHGHHHHHGPLGAAHAPGLSPARMIEIEENILAHNDHLAAHNREDFQRDGTLALNLVSSPGSGKTTLLVETAKALGGDIPITVIEGDQQTDLDADRIRETGALAVQVNTGKGCHLDADMVRRAMRTLEPDPGGVLFIENVGNLVCPAGFDLGEAAKVVILSVTEGADKPLKYPDMFRAARLMLINKSDLLPYVPFDVETCIEYARRVNPQIGVITVSALTGDGMDRWYGWIAAQRAERAALAATG